MAQFAKNVTLFLMDSGEPNGRWLCDLSNWTGLIYRIPRLLIHKCTDRANLNQPGVYFLVGKDDFTGKSLIYIGESENVLARLLQHLGGKDFWNEAIVILDQSNRLNKAHIKYLENAFYSKAQESGKYIVKNGNAPQPAIVHETDRAILGEFIYNTIIIVSILGHDVFQEPPSPPSVSDARSASESELLFIKSKSKGVIATGRATTSGFIVYSGSRINDSISASLRAIHGKLRAKHIASGDIVGSAFTKDIVFKSSSAASDLILGYSSSGPQTWKTKDGITLKQIEDGAK